MLGNYIKTAFRYFIKDKVFTLINIIGFIISITFALLLFIWIQNEFSYEKDFSDSHRIFRVVEIAEQNSEIVKNAQTYMPLADALNNSFPFIENSAFIKYEVVYALQYESKKLECQPGYIDNSFFKIFDFKFIEGNSENLINQPDGVVITKKIAKKLFGEEKALGKELIHNWYSNKYPFIVVGVIDQPANTHLGFDILFSINNSYHNQIKKHFGENWRNAEHINTYIKVKNHYVIKADEKLELANFLKNFKNTTSRLWFQPILDIHLRQDFNYYYDKNLGSIKIVQLYALLAILLLVISVFNFINLNMARITNRFKEIAIRKINGGSQRSIAIQFFIEMILQSVLAVYVALIFTEIARPIFNNIIGYHLYIPYSISFFVYLLILGILLGILSGIYPSIFLSRLSPMSIFAQRNPKSVNQIIIRILTIFQFMAAAAMLIIGTVISQQLKYIENKDLGIEKENILTLKTGLWYDAKVFQQEIIQNPKVLGSTAITNNPVDFSITNKEVKWEGMQEGVAMTQVFVDAGFLDTYKPKIVQGEFLYSDFNKYWEKDTAAISIPTVINERAKKIIGKDDPIGTRLNKDYVVIGVVKDFHFQSLHNAIMPIMMSYNPEAIFEIDIRMSPENKQETIKYLKETYLKHRPDRTFEYHFFDDLLDQSYQDEKKLSQIVFVFIIFCMIISTLGVVGLSVLETVKKTKEIAIRKVNGATATEIVFLIGRKHIINIIIAFVCGGIIAMYFINQWLLNFAYKVQLGFLSFAIPFFVLGFISLITVYIVVSKASRANPVESLRYE
jgi:putative ABC transport system permease protein